MSAYRGIARSETELEYSPHGTVRNRLPLVTVLIGAAAGLASWVLIAALRGKPMGDAVVLGAAFSLSWILFGVLGRIRRVHRARVRIVFHRSGRTLRIDGPHVRRSVAYAEIARAEVLPDAGEPRVCLVLRTGEHIALANEAEPGAHHEDFAARLNDAILSNVLTE